MSWIIWLAFSTASAVPWIVTLRSSEHAAGVSDEEWIEDYKGG